MKLLSAVSIVVAVGTFVGAASPGDVNSTVSTAIQSAGVGSNGGSTKTFGVADPAPQLANGGSNRHAYTPAIRDYIVQAHNHARARLVPTEAANMRKLAWHDGLAIEASELVDSCVFEHDTEGYTYGQNLIYGGSLTLDTATVDAWIHAWVSDEISERDRASDGFMDLDHASAVLWADTFLVGCASNLCPRGFLTVCNYFTPGNWQGARTYVPGKPCSLCPAQAPQCDTETGKLCTADTDDADSSQAQAESGVLQAPPLDPVPAPVLLAVVSASSKSPVMQQHLTQTQTPLSARTSNRTTTTTTKRAPKLCHN